ncbi:MAG: DUF3365 domain-containing protein [Sulfurimonas sp.]|nr:DUF3365 domain-containing protein [Sulfurimonas sp.]
MLETLLKRTRIMLILFFLTGSLIFYSLLEQFFQEETSKFVKNNILFSQAIQEYISTHQQPAIYKLIEEKKLPKNYFDPSIMSSTYIISSVHNIVKQKLLKENIAIDRQVEFKFASDNPTNINNKATEFESNILKKFNSSNIASYREYITHKGKETLFYALPVVKNSVACLKCHGVPSDAPPKMIEVYGDKNGFYEKEGEIRAINVAYSTVDPNSSMLTFFLVIESLMLVIFSIIYFAVRYFIIQLSKKDKLITKQSKFAAMGEMTSMIAHQWRQPLTGMSITINNILLDIELEELDGQKVKKDLEIVNQQIEYLSHTIDDFKNFFKPNIKSDSVDINKLIDNSCMLIASTMKTNGIEIKKIYHSNLIAFTKANDLQQVLLNLIKNSMDAYLENDIQERIIQITTEKKTDDIIIKIKDNAGGIPKDILDKIFDPYFSTKDKKNGTGLGLYMSKMIIEDHLNGQLLVDTDNRSTIFQIILAIKESN